MLSYWMIQDTKGLASKSYERNMIIMNCMAIQIRIKPDISFGLKLMDLHTCIQIEVCLYMVKS